MQSHWLHPIRIGCTPFAFVAPLSAFIAPQLSIRCSVVAFIAHLHLLHPSSHSLPHLLHLVKHLLLSAFVALHPVCICCISRICCCLFHICCTATFSVHRSHLLHPVWHSLPSLHLLHPPLVVFGHAFVAINHTLIILHPAILAFVASPFHISFWLCPHDILWYPDWAL